MVTKSQQRRSTNKEESLDASRAVRVQDDRRLTQMHVWAVLRISLGWIFLWAFLDKTFGLGAATESDNAWVDGGSPTEGYLSFATRGP